MEQSHYIELYKHLNDKIVEAGNLYFRSAILINGGAAVAVLGFVASIAKADDRFGSVIYQVAGAVALFAFGAAAAVGGIALAYLTNYAATASLNNQGEKHEKLFDAIKRGFHIASIAAAFASIVLFVMGALAVKAAILAGVAG